MNANTNVHLNEVISLLKKLAPERVEQLKNDFPDISEELISSRWCGDEVRDEGEKAYLLVNKRALAVLDSIKYFDSLAVDAINLCVVNIRRFRRFRLASDLFTIVGTSSVLGSLGLQKPDIAIYMALFALASSALKLISEFIQLTPGSAKNISMQAAYERLSSAVLELRTIRTELQLHVQFNSKVSELNKTMRDANVLCREISGSIAPLLMYQAKQKGDILLKIS